jgi:hypothetical protein
VRRALSALLLAAACGGGGGTDGGSADGRLPDASPPDVALAACGIEEPGSRCVGAAGLERCDGTSIVSETCPSGTMCGSDIDLGAGASCGQSGGPCGVVTTVGACSGPMLTRCTTSGLLIVDCGSSFAGCAWDPVKLVYRCASECENRGVNAEGKCVDGRLQRCVFSDGQFRVVSDACPAGTVCVTFGPDTGKPACAPEPPCGALGAGGACDGDVLSRCAGGSLDTVDCGAAGQVCAWTGAAGYGCVARGATGGRRVSGTVRYEDRVATLDGLRPATLRPVRAAGVTLLDDGGAALATAATADDGSYTLRYDAPDGAVVRVLVVSAAIGDARPARVLRPDGLLHGFASDKRTVAAELRLDVAVTERSGLAEAFNILDDLVTGMDLVRASFDVVAPQPLAAIWQKGTTTGTFQSGPMIFLRGSVADDDGYDDAVILHELGHYVEVYYGRTDSPMTPVHVIRVPEDPRLAWSEGWASYFGSAVRRDPRYVDTNALGAFGFDLDADVTRAPSSGDETENISENTVGEILWDLGDGGNGDDDPAPGPHSSVIHVENRYFTMQLPERGAAGIDLVDFLDGYVTLNGSDHCAALRAVVASRNFPYDFAGPVPCP